MLLLRWAWKHNIKPWKRNNQHQEYLHNTSPLNLPILEPKKWTTQKSDTHFGKKFLSQYINEDEYNKDGDVLINNVFFTIYVEAVEL